jgi:hypothetical protein
VGPGLLCCGWLALAEDFFILLPRFAIILSGQLSLQNCVKKITIKFLTNNMHGLKMAMLSKDSGRITFNRQQRSENKQCAWLDNFQKVSF